MRPEGVTNHYRGIFVTDPDALSDADFLAGTTAISNAILDAVRVAPWPTSDAIAGPEGATSHAAPVVRVQAWAETKYERAVASDHQPQQGNSWSVGLAQAPQGHIDQCALVPFHCGLT